jgi:hypothetical protein
LAIGSLYFTPDRARAREALTTFEQVQGSLVVTRNLQQVVKPDKVLLRLLRDIDD